MSDQTILERTLAAAKHDPQFVDPSGEPIRRLTEGVQIRPLTTHVDLRGSVTELFDPRWGWHADPLAFIYCFTIARGTVKGWSLHREHDDRYAILSGTMELVLFDPRPGSSTCGEICRIVLSEHHRCLVNVPRNVWHADHNIGTRDVVAVNMPTTPYDHANPDKYRLPIDSPLIPHSFGDAKGW